MPGERGFDRKSQSGKVPEPDVRVEVLVIGAGPSGVAAATAAAKGGAQVLLVDETPVGAGLMGLDAPFFFGGRYTAAVQSRQRMMAQVLAARPGLEDAHEAGVQIELGVSCWGAWTPGYGLASLPCALAGLADEERAWMVGFERLILATGARDVVLSFKGWEQPGVLGARGLESLLTDYDAFVGRRLVILGSGELGLGCARLARERGLEVAAIVEVEDAVRADPAAFRALGAECLTGFAPLEARGGRDGVESLVIGNLQSGNRREVICDTIVQAVSLTPAVEILDVLGAQIAMQSRLGGHAPVSLDGAATSQPHVFIAGDVAGVPGGSHLTAEAAIESGRRAAHSVLASLGRRSAEDFAERTDQGLDAVTVQQTWARALMAQNGDSVIVCLCEEVSRQALLSVQPPAYLGPATPTQAARGLARLLQDGPPNQDQIKRLTRAGMGPCQGRRCREQIALTLACASNCSAELIPLAGYRAPVRPLPLKVLADWNEAPVMGRHWDVWMGIRGQWAPYADVGTDRETVNDDLLGGDLHL